MEILDSTESFLHWDRNLSELSEPGENEHVLYSTLSFVGYQARQVVVVLSGSQAPLSPSQAVLLFQRCRVLLACLKYSSHLGQHLRTEYREEFRYYVKLPCVEAKLPPDYPISQPALRLVSQLLGLIIQKS